MLLNTSNVFSDLLILRFKLEASFFDQTDDRYLFFDFLAHIGQRFHDLVSFIHYGRYILAQLHKMTSLLSAVDFGVIELTGEACLLTFLILNIAQKPVEF